MSIDYDIAAKVAHCALDNDLALKQPALKLGFVTEDEFDCVVDPERVAHPQVASASREVSSSKSSQSRPDLTEEIESPTRGLGTSSAAY